MPNPNFMILYVDDPTESAALYANLLDRKPVEASPSFVLFALGSGLMLGLWSRRNIDPPASQGHGGELAFTVDGAAAVDDTYETWLKKGLAILQQPTNMDFGRTFLAVDPDGHRLRVFAPTA